MDVGKVEIFYDEDADLNVLKKRKIAVMGYGNQGRAQALCLKDSGMDVVVADLKDSPAWKKAEEDGMKIMTVSEAAQWADYIQVLLPDELQKSIYDKEIAPYMTKGKVLGFSHGFNIFYHQIIPPAGVDVVMAAPKAPGAIERRLYTEGKGVPALACVDKDESGNAWDLVLSYCKAQGWTRAGVIKSTFRDETVEDLFGEQAVLCGGVVELVKAGFETLVEADFPPELAYFETYHELKLIVDLMYEGGIVHMFNSISNTAEYGALTRGKMVITEETKKNMKKILEDIENGTFATEWLLENKVGRPKFRNLLERQKNHLIEKAGERVRSMFPWSKNTGEKK